MTPQVESTDPAEHDRTLRRYVPEENVLEEAFQDLEVAPFAKGEMAVDRINQACSTNSLPAPTNEGLLLARRQTAPTRPKTKLSTVTSLGTDDRTDIGWMFKWQSVIRSSVVRGVFLCVLLAGLSMGFLVGERGPNQNELATFGSPTFELVSHQPALPDLTGPITKAIDEIEVGERVLGVNPEVDVETLVLEEPDPATWRKLRLEMQQDAGTKVDIVLLRPTTWLEITGAALHRTISLELPEMELSGPARVLSIEPCPPIRPGTGSVVTGTFTSTPADELVEVRVAGAQQPIRCTRRHPFWSEDRQTFVDAGKLKVGERLRSRSGQAVEVASIEPIPAVDRVFNIEVHNQHVYQVSADGLLVHNNCGKGKPGVKKSGQSKRPLWTPTKTKSGVQNAHGHFKKHGSEFPEYPNATQYAQGARNFVTNPPKGTLTKIRPNGDKLFYDPATNTFAAQRKDGALRTIFRPTDGFNYWNKQ